MSGAVLSEAIPRTVSLAWAANGRTLFYTVEDEAKRDEIEANIKKAIATKAGQ